MFSFVAQSHKMWNIFLNTARRGCAETVHTLFKLSTGHNWPVVVTCLCSAGRFTYEDFLSAYGVLLPRPTLSLDNKENETPVNLSPRSVRQRRRTLLPSAELNMSASEAVTQLYSKGQPSTPSNVG